MFFHKEEKKMRKNNFFIALLLGLSIAITGCGQHSKTDSTSSSSVASVESSQTSIGKSTSVVSGSGTSKSAEATSEADGKTNTGASGKTESSAESSSKVVTKVNESTSKTDSKPATVTSTPDTNVQQPPVTAGVPPIVTNNNTTEQPAQPAQPTISAAEAARITQLTRLVQQYTVNGVFDFYGFANSAGLTAEYFGEIEDSRFFTYLITFSKTGFSWHCDITTELFPGYETICCMGIGNTNDNTPYAHILGREGGQPITVTYNPEAHITQESLNKLPYLITYLETYGAEPDGNKAPAALYGFNFVNID